MNLSLRIRPKKYLRLTLNRPSLLDPRLRGDPWVGMCTHPELLVLYFNNQPVHLVPGTRLDMASLNSLLFQLRNRYPRKAPRGISRT
jgi:hypothetical protein